MPVNRRQALGLLAWSGVAATAGCTGGGNGAPEAADVVAGPGGRLVFEPAEITVQTGETVTWRFETASHNVSCRPSDTETARLPEGAEPFATYGPDESPLTLVQAGEEFEHRFAVAGTFVYVCVPHEQAGMIGRVEVEG